MTNQYAENGQICNKNILNIFTKKIWTFVLHPPIHRSPKKTEKKAKSWLPLWFGHPGCEKWFSNHQMIAITVSNYCSPTARRSGFWVLMGFCVVLNMTWCEIVLPWCGFVRYCGCCGIVLWGRVWNCIALALSDMAWCDIVLVLVLVIMLVHCALHCSACCAACGCGKFPPSPECGWLALAPIASLLCFTIRRSLYVRATTTECHHIRNRSWFGIFSTFSTNLYQLDNIAIWPSW